MRAVAFIETPTESQEEAGGMKNPTALHPPMCTSCWLKPVEARVQENMGNTVCRGQPPWTGADGEG